MHGNGAGDITDSRGDGDAGLAVARVNYAMVVADQLKLNVIPDELAKNPRVAPLLDELAKTILGECPDGTSYVGSYPLILKFLSSPLPPSFDLKSTIYPLRKLLPTSDSVMARFWKISQDRDCI